MMVGLFLARMDHFAPPLRLLLLEVSFETIMVVLLRLLQRTWGAALSLELRCEWL
ncbi:hypothetical protein LINGRAHAP2_LOCUS29308 [Linum grandiflorum]